MDNFVIRPPRLDDAEAVAALINTCSMAVSGVPVTTPDQLRSRWTMPWVDLERSAWLVAAPSGELAAYAFLEPTSDTHTHYRATGRVHPDYRQRGIGSYLMQQMEGRAREWIALADPQHRVTINAGCSHEDTDASGLILANGFAELRRFHTMRIDFDGPPPEAQWPAGVSVRQMVADQDERAVWEADEDIFKDHWGFLPRPFEAWLAMLKNQHYDPAVSFLALADGQIVGISLNAPGTLEDPNMGYIDTLGVRRAWRRQGIALALLYQSFGALYRLGKTSAALNVDASSLTDATKLYKRAGMRTVRQFVTYEKELRPGQEISTRSLQNG